MASFDEQVSEMDEYLWSVMRRHRDQMAENVSYLIRDPDTPDVHSDMTLKEFVLWLRTAKIR